jgi:hypothetical protein
VISPLSNPAGWNNSNVTVTLNATGAAGGAGVREITYSTTGAQPSAPITVAGASVQIVISSEGLTTLTFAATDDAGVTESPAKSITVRIDRTAPDVSTQFDPVGKDLLVFGHDGGSGLASGLLAASTHGPVAAGASSSLQASPPTSVQPALWTSADDPPDVTSDAGSRPSELRTYAISDLAGNTTVLIVKVRRPVPDESQIRARLVSIQYGKSPPTTFGDNLEVFDWTVARDQSLATLDELIRLGLGPSRQVIEAHYTTRQAHTDITIRNPRLQPVIHKPGLDLLRLVTSKGQLSIEY